MRFISLVMSFFFIIPSVEAAVNINTADSSALQVFNGVGPSTAQKIIDFRVANGHFTSCDDLVKVKGIGPATLQKIKPDCIVEQGGEPPKVETSSSTVSGTGHIDINTADLKSLQAFNGVGPSTAQKIVDYRTSSGAFKSCSDLLNINGIGAKTLEKIQPDCTVSVKE